MDQNRKRAQKTALSHYDAAGYAHPISEKINIYVAHWYCDDEIAKPGMALDC